MPNDKSPPKSKTATQQETGGDCVSRLVVPLDSPWIVVDGDYDAVEIHSSRPGEDSYVCTVNGGTLGQVVDRASLIAAAPDTLEYCRALESALRRLLTADIPRPHGAIVDDEEQRAAIEWNAFERGEARQHARSILRHNA